MESLNPRIDGIFQDVTCRMCQSGERVGSNIVTLNNAVMHYCDHEYFYCDAWIGHDHQLKRIAVRRVRGCGTSYAIGNESLLRAKLNYDGYIKDFALLEAHRWKRPGKDSPWITDEPRPHIVPLCDLAEDFLNYVLHNAVMNEYKVFGPMYTAFGNVELAASGRTVLAARLKPQPEDQKTKTLQRVMTGYTRWLEEGCPKPDPEPS